MDGQYKNACPSTETAIFVDGTMKIRVFVRLLRQKS